MKKLLLLLTLSFFSAQSFAGSCPDGSEPVKSISADGTYFVYNCGNTNNEKTSATTNGRWRGIVVCDWDKEQWGGGEYKLGNGKLSGKIDFTVSKGTIKAGNHDYPLFACSKNIDT